MWWCQFQNIYSLAVLLLSENKIVRIFFVSAVVTVLVNNVDKNSQVDRQMRFSLPPIKCSAGPPSIRLLPSTVLLTEVGTTI